MAVVRGSRLKNSTRPVFSAPAAPPTTEAHPAEQPTERIAPESRPERLRREIFERLVEAARQLMFSRSLDDARVQDITDLADVGKGTFFNFFSAKELIIPEITRERVRRHRQSVDEMKAGQISSREALNQIIDTSRERKLTPADWHNYFGTFVTSIAHDERVRSSISDLIREGEQLVREVVAFGQESGEFRDDRDTSDLANYLLRAFLGLQLTAWVHGVGLNADELEANARLTFDLLLCPPSSTRQVRKVAKSPTRSPIRPSQRPNPHHTERKRRNRGGSH
jgi:AcrR family transcriptional regulator